MKILPKIIFVVLIISLLSFFLFIALGFKPIISYTISFVLSSAVFIAACVVIVKNEISVKYVLSLVAIGVILRVIFIPIHPTGSDDYYRYVWDGKVQASGINPYEYAPSDTALTFLHNENLPRLVSYPKIKTIYPPLAEILFYAAYLIGGDSYIGLKLLILIAEVFALYGLFLILKKLKLHYKNILIYALCPLPFFQFFIDGHLDIFGIALLIFSIFFYLDEKKILSYIFLGLSLSIKPLGLILIPIIFINEKNAVNMIKSIVIPIAIFIALYIPYVFSGSPFQALINFTKNWTFNGVVFDILDSFIHNNQITRLYCAILLFIFYLPVIFSRKNLLTKTYISIVLLYIFSPIVHPWYVTWLAILVPIIMRWSGILYISLISLTVFTELNYKLYGVWHEYMWVLIIEYVPVLLLFVYELLKFRGTTKDSLPTLNN